MKNQYDQNITFLPTRLNREATVFGGMTMSEFGISAVIGFIVGLIIGVLLWVVSGFWILIPAMAMLLCIVTVLIGKVVFARIKRDKPEAYLNRLLEFKLDGVLSSGKFITREGFWSTQKSKGCRK